MLFHNRRRVRNFGIALVLFAGAVWILPSYLSVERYRRRLQTSLERTLHRPVKFGALSLRLVPRPGFSIEEVEVDEDPEFGSEPFARVDHIDCDLRWHSLWRSRMDFARLHLDRPSFNVVINSRGNWNVAKLLLQSGVTAPAGALRGGGASAPPQQLDLDVDDARINFQVGSDKKPFALTDVRANLQINPQGRQVQFHITASPVRSDLTIPTPGPVEASGSWAPGADLRGPLDARLRARGALLYDWIPVVTGENPQIYGVIDSDIHLTGALPELVVEGETSLTQLHRWKELPPSDPMPCTIRFRSRFVPGRGRVQVENLDASFADSHARLAGSVSSLHSNPQLDFVVSLERSRLQDFQAAVRRVWPQANSWNVKGRIDAMLAVQGSWRQRRYGGFVGAREISLETPSGTFALSDIAMRINNRGAVLAPVQISIAPRVVLSAQGGLNRSGSGPQYELHVAAKNIPLYDAVSFGRAMGIKGLQALGASGSVTTTLRLSGSAWPPTRPVLSGHADLRAARLLIPGLTEPLNLPRASLQFSGHHITVDPLIAVLGTSVFTAQLSHEGARAEPWMFDLRANTLSLDQGALWFDALGLRRPVPLLERLPGMASSAARREAAAQILGRLNAKGRFATPVLTYRGATLKNFQGHFEVAGRSIRMTGAKFHAAGGRAEAEGSVDFTVLPPALSARVSMERMPLQSLTGRFSGPVREFRGSLSGGGDFRTRGLGREELAENLTGRMSLRVEEISFGDFDPLGTLVEQSHWGKLEPALDSSIVLPATFNMEIRDHHFIIKNTVIDLSGARLLCSGTYAWSGAMNVNIDANLRHLRRRWLERDDAPQPSALPFAVRLNGPIEHLTVSSR
jgi:hypothetical protein